MMNLFVLMLFLALILLGSSMAFTPLLLERSSRTRKISRTSMNAEGGNDGGGLHLEMRVKLIESTNGIIFIESLKGVQDSVENVEKRLIKLEEGSAEVNESLARVNESLARVKGSLVTLDKNLDAKIQSVKPNRLVHVAIMVASCVVGSGGFPFLLKYFV